MLKPNIDKKAASDAIDLLLEMAAIPVPVRFTKPNAKTSSSHIKFNLLMSIGWVSQILITLNSNMKTIAQINPKNISEGIIIIDVDNFGIKNASGAQTTFAVMDSEAMGANIPLFFNGSCMKSL